jgi:hypothetical protein
MDQLSEILKELKKIEPHPHFTETSRMRILHTPKILRESPASPVWSAWIFERLSSVTAVYAAFLGVIFLSGTLFLQTKTAPYLAMLNFDEKEKESEELAIQINLSELALYEKAEQIIHVALFETAAQNQKKETAYEKTTPGNGSSAPVNHDIDKALELML